MQALELARGGSARGQMELVRMARALVAGWFAGKREGLTDDLAAHMDLHTWRAALRWDPTKGRLFSYLTATVANQWRFYWHDEAERQARRVQTVSLEAVGIGEEDDGSEES